MEQNEIGIIMEAHLGCDFGDDFVMCVCCVCVGVCVCVYVYVF